MKAANTTAQPQPPSVGVDSSADDLFVDPEDPYDVFLAPPGLTGTTEAASSFFMSLLGSVANMKITMVGVQLWRRGQFFFKTTKILQNKNTALAVFYGLHEPSLAC